METSSNSYIYANHYEIFLCNFFFKFLQLDSALLSGVSFTIDRMVSSKGWIACIVATQILEIAQDP